MKQISILLLFLLISATYLANDRLFFKFKDESMKITIDYKGDKLISSIQYNEFEKLISKFNISKIYDPIKTSSKALDVTFAIELIDFKKNSKKLIQALKAYSFIEYVENDSKFETFHTPTDPNYNTQWYLTKINADAAWHTYLATASLTAPKVVVAVIDDAILLSHQDLAPVIYTNSAEIAANGIDDDGNGYIDDITGWDAANLNNNPNPPATATNSYFTHGTHVAGLVGAQTDNALGIASVGFDIKILPVKIGRDIDAALTGAFGGLDYAINCGYTDVINMSWGSASFSQTYQNLINAGNANGIIFVAAAGNSNSSALFYPASYNHVISVAASDQSDLKASFSNYGSAIDVVAPGVNIFSTTAGSNSSYNTFQGTSMASPLVAGLCGLMVAHSPGISPASVEFCLKSTSTNIYGINPTYSSQLGDGRINANLALLCLNGPPIVNIGSNFKFACVGQSITFQDSCLGMPATSWSWSFPGGSPSTSTLQNPVVSYPTNGVYSVTLTATNSFGSSSQSFTNYISIGNQSATISGNNVINSGSPSTLRFDFVGNPPYNFVYTDGVSNFPGTTSSTPHYVTIPAISTSTIYSLVSYNDVGCSGIVNGNANIQVNITPGCLNDDDFMNNWYFGSYAGITFNTNPPSALPASSMYAGEGCASISDSNGVSLFYTNGNTAWDASHFQISTSNLGGSQVSAQSSIITPVPGSPNLYYIFTVNNWTDASSNFEYSIYNKTSNSITTGPTTIVNNVYEQVVATYHQNGTDIWVVVHNTALAGNQFLAYKLDGTLPHLITPVISTSSVTGGMQYSGGNRYGGMKFSQNGKLLSSALGGSRTNSTLSLFQFDKTTGFISNELIIETGVALTLYMYSTEFSPDNSTLYATEFNTNSIHRYNISTLNQAAIRASKLTTYVTASNATSLQLGSDKKIYACISGRNFLGAFNSPNNFTNPNYSNNVITLNGTGRLGLPNFFNTGIESDIIQDTVVCNGSYPFTLDATTIGGITKVEWFDGSGTSLDTTNTYSISGPGAYYVDRTNTKGCTWRDYFTINSDSFPSSFVSDTTFCIGETRQLRSIGTGSIRWFPSSSVSNDTIDNPIFTGVTTQMMYITRTSIKGCELLDSILITIDSTCCKVYASFNASDSTVCVGSTISFTNTTTTTSLISTPTYSWSFGSSATPTASTILNPITSFNNHGTYKVVLTASNTCGSDRDSLLIHVINLPDMSDFKDTNVCVDSLSTNFEIGAIPISNYKYSWFPSTGLSDANIANPIFTGTTSQRYVLTITNSLGCSDTTEILISIYQKPNIEIGNDSIICVGTSLTFSNSATNLFSSPIIYNWDFGTNNSLSKSDNANPTFKYKTPGIYTVILTMINNCGVTRDTLTVTVFANPIANIGGDELIYEGTSIQFDNTANNSFSSPIRYNWDFGVGTIPLTSTIKNPEVQFNSSGINMITLIVTNQEGCVGMDTKRVTIESILGIWVPSAFTPNDDGLNETFKVIFNNVGVEDYSLFIFNRWGEIIFYTEETDSDWDGKFKGELVPKGVYIWKMMGREEFTTDRFIKHGHFTLIR